MSNIKKWGYINKTYNECSRSAILRREFSKNKVYWVFGIIYFSISLIALCFSQTHFFWSIVSVAITALCIYYLIERQLSKDFVELYNQNGLMDYPLFSRTKYLSYILFREKLKKDKKVNSSDVDSMILWDKIRNEKIDTSVFFTSKWFLILATATIGLFVQYFLGLNLNIKDIALIAYLAFVITWLSWILFEFFNTKNKKRLEISRFLKWFKLDSEKA